MVTSQALGKVERQRGDVSIMSLAVLVGSAGHHNTTSTVNPPPDC